MKKIIKSFLRTKHSLFFKRAVSSLNKQIAEEQRESDEMLDQIHEDGIVRLGMFMGMRLPPLPSSPVNYPMLIGSYEEEVQTVLDRLIRKDYKEILDIGCAEGYYAVGLALKTSAQIYAYDTDRSILEVCRIVAKENGVENRISFEDICTSEKLANFKFTNGLVISDCEGYEKELFTQESVKNLVDCDLVIELHEFVNRDIQDKLVSLFSATHACSIVTSDNYFKHITRDPKKYRHVLGNMNHDIKMKALHEARQEPMGWLVCERDEKKAAYSSSNEKEHA